jgi:hypothetical protein
MICLEAFISSEKIKVLKCLHIFHPKCLLEWLTNKSLCPLCKDEQTGQDIMINLKGGRFMKYSSLFDKDYIRNLTSSSGDTNSSMISTLGKSIKQEMPTSIKRKRNHQPSNISIISQVNASINLSNVSMVATEIPANQ